MIINFYNNYLVLKHTTRQKTAVGVRAVRWVEFGCSPQESGTAKARERQRIRTVCLTA